MDDGSVTVQGEHVVIAVRMKPGSRLNSIERLAGGKLIVRVAARPVEGAANRALIELLSEWLDVPKSAISISSGRASRDKVVRVYAADLTPHPGQAPGSRS